MDQAPVGGNAFNLPRFLTGPVTAPVGSAPPNTTVPAATPTMAADQRATAPMAPAAPRDPQILAILPIFAHQLTSTNPVDVTMALSALEAYGPAYTADVSGMVLSALKGSPGGMQSQELLDYLVRNKVTSAMPVIEQMVRNSEGPARTAASTALRDLIGATAPPAAAPGGVAPAATTVPGAAPAAAPTTAATNPNGPLPAHLQGFLDRLRVPGAESASACVDISRLPIQDAIAVTRAALQDPARLWGVDTLLTSGLAKRVGEPGVIETMRDISKQTGLSKEAQLRVGVALLYHGTTADLPFVLTILANGKGAYTSETQKILIDSLAARPDFLNVDATIATLGALINDRNSWLAGIAAVKALSHSPSQRAKDIVGTAPQFTDYTYQPQVRIDALRLILNQPKPYSAATIEAVRRVSVEKTEGHEEVAKEAKAILRRIS